MKVLILGGSGGIGLATLSIILNQQPFCDIIATYRSTPPPLQNDRVKWMLFDALNPEHYENLFAQMGRLDWLINAIGLLHDETLSPEKTIKRVKQDDFMRAMENNAMPTLLLAKHAHHVLKQSDQAVFISVSAKVGSIQDNRLGGWYSYRASKAALNMILKTLSIEWQRTLPQVCVAAYHPGTTDSKLSKPFQAGVAPEKLFTPEQSAHYLYRVLTHLTPDKTGKFWSWDGSEIAW